MIKRKFQALLCLFGISAIISAAVPAAPEKLPDIKSKSEEGGFIDLTFRLTKAQFRPDGTCAVSAAGQWQGQAVGFTALVPANTEPGFRPNGSVTKKGIDIVTIASCGESSDRFIVALAKLYNLKSRRSKMRSKTEFASFCLEGTDLKRMPMKLKLFHGEDENAAEVYLNLDLPHHVVELAEKDPEYRKSLFDALSSP